MKKWVIFLFSLVIFSSLSGCGRVYSQKSVGAFLVNRIHLHCDSCDTALDRYYSDPEKLRIILLCIRQLGPDFPTAEDVEALAGKTLALTLYCADGTTHTYRIKNNQYLQKDAGPWRQINADHASGFYQLLTILPPDVTDAGRQAPSDSSRAYRVYSPVLRGMRSQKS